MPQSLRGLCIISSMMQPGRPSAVVLLLFLNLFLMANGNSDGFSKFFDKHKTAIQNYMMVGYGDGWSDCDIIRHILFW